MGSPFPTGDPESGKEPPAPPENGREEGVRLGSYRLLRVLGQGGMGTVYLARRDDEQYERQVAVKVLRSGLEDAALRYRFLTERQVLARLEHPAIARLYDGGSTEDGRPYLVMELVDGLPIDEYCDQNRLTIERRLALFLRVGAAVQHAHQNLLVHRDIKPANILVDAQGEPKLLDFGIAKRLAEAADDTRTRTGLRVMTPTYASPEQVRGEPVATTSDVFSLGVLLYGLLAGCSPHPVAAGAPRFELERAILERQPEKPSAALLRLGREELEALAAARGCRPAALRRRLRGDLDTIVLKALRKEPARRYESVAALCADLEQHLRDLPVSARPDSLSYRTAKFVRRHRAAVAVAAGIAALVAALGTTLFVEGRRTARERDKARYALSFLVDTFKQADPFHTQGEALSARQILDRGAERIQRDLAGQPEVQAAVMDAIGEVDLGLGRYDAAEPLLRQALALRRQAFGPASPEEAESLEHLAELQGERTDFPAAETTLRRALALRRSQKGGDGLALAGTLNQLGKLLVQRGVSDASAREVEALHREALALARRAEGAAGPTVTATLLALADLQGAQGHYGDAERLFRQGLESERRALGEGDPRYWLDLSRLGQTLIEAGKYSEAEEVLRRCLAVQRQLVGRDHPDAISTLSGVAVAMHLQGRYAESERLQREVLALARAQLGPDHWRVTEALLNIGADLAGQKRNAEAVRLYEEALEIRRRTVGETHWQVGQVLLLLAELQREMKQLPRALAFALQARDVFAAGEGPDHPYVAHALREIGRVYLEEDRYAEAEPFLRRCLEIRQKNLEPNHPDLAKAQLTLARALAGQGEYAEAESLLRPALATFTTVYGPSADVLRTTRELLAKCVEERGRARPR